MKKTILFLLLTFLIISCSVRQLTSVSTEPVEVKSQLSKDEVWSKLVDIFAKEGYEIKIIDKSSGLITTEEYSFISNYTTENKKGIQKNPNAYIVVQKKGWSGPQNVLGKWNVRVKDNTEGGSLINVNIVNLKAYSISKYGYENYLVATNHIFEKELAEKFK